MMHVKRFKTLPPEGTSLAFDHLLSHEKQQPAVAFINATHKPAEAAQQARLFSRTPPRDIISSLPLGKIRQHRRLFAVVEKLVERDFHRPRQLFQRLDRRNGVPVFDARDVTAKKTSALFDVALGKFFCFTKQTDAISDYHGDIVTWTSGACKLKLALSMAF
jgi:hypothetical protein